ncbi:MAG: ATP-binding protein [Clostridiaceae bacterium]|nr:ATP-binding protein [Clostridiaceae bacterium]
MESYMNNIYDEINREYTAIRELNKNKQEKAIEQIYRKIPRIKKIDEQISEIALGVAADVIKGGINPNRTIRKMQTDIKSLTDEKTRLLINANYPTNIMDEIFCCEVCKDKGYFDGNRCKCYLQKRNALLQKYSNIKMCSNSSFEKFSIELFSDDKDKKYGVSPRENMRSVYNIALSFANGEEGAAKNLLFYGATGLGKTFTSDCIAKRYIDQGKTVFYMSAPKMFSIFEDYKFGRNTSEETQRIISSVTSAQLLIIDDLGTEFRNSYSDSILFDVINSRIIEQSPMIISTNLSIKDLKHIYSERICSRILGNFNVVLFFGDDLRLTAI